MCVFGTTIMLILYNQLSKKYIYNRDYHRWLKRNDLDIIIDKKEIREHNLILPNLLTNKG